MQEPENVKRARIAWELAFVNCVNLEKELRRVMVNKEGLGHNEVRNEMEKVNEDLKIAMQAREAARIAYSNACNTIT